MKKSRRFRDVESEINLLDLIRDSGFNVKRLNDKSYRVNPCPFCGHQDHFTVYPEENRYYTYAECASNCDNELNNNCGSVAEYLMETEECSQEEAQKMVYEMLGHDSDEEDS